MRLIVQGQGLYGLRFNVKGLELRIQDLRVVVAVGGIWVYV